MTLSDMKGLPHLVKPVTLEMGYSGVFTLFELINFFYFLVNMCKHYNFWLMCGEFFSAFLCLTWLFNALQWLRAPPPLTASKGPSKRGRSNQDNANATPGSNTHDYVDPTRSVPNDYSAAPRRYPDDFNTAPRSYADEYNATQKSYPNGVNPAPRSYPAGLKPAPRSYQADDYYYD
ncbi:unnamed protein product [Cylicostephanus goldi]|uniref:MARVEL domain-containing protein n=1 Tax=Cylicostephanus goldi TaxID=71465 RepID=A0A3P6QCX6_CYLGO|nr:unnamed protein product [Cylicostephanus goldi]